MQAFFNRAAKLSQRIWTELRYRWHMSLRTRAGIIALVVAIMMMSSEILAQSCWDQYLKALNQAQNEYKQCISDVYWRMNEFGVPQILMEELTFQQELCQIKWLSDAWQAEASYISCMTLEAVISLFR